MVTQPDGLWAASPPALWSSKANAVHKADRTPPSLLFSSTILILYIFSYRCSAFKDV